MERVFDAVSKYQGESNELLARQHDRLSDSVQIEIHTLGLIAKMTHETKNKVKQGLTPEDYKSVGVNNPDIWVVSKTDDHIVLTRPKSMGKGKKHITNAKASNLLGPDWLKKINVLSLLTNTKIRHLVLDIQHDRVSTDILDNKVIAFARVGPFDWLVIPVSV